MRIFALAVIALFGTLLSSVAAAQKVTPLLEDNLQTNQKKKIDAGGGDLDLDSIMGGGGGFSTKTLEQISDKLRNDIRRDRPRASPRLVIFVYPGRVAIEKLRAMSEILVDLELVMDPCERSVCREAVGKHIEMVGRAVGKPTISTGSYKVTFKNLTLRTSTTMHDTEVETYNIPIADCINASQKPGGGLQWLNNRQKSEDDYEPLMVKALVRHAGGYRVALNGIPTVKRGGGAVAVTMKVKGDRNRGKQQVTDALAAAGAALKSSPATPSTSEVEVVLDVPMKGTNTRKFRSTGQPLGLYADGKMDMGSLWSNYVQEVKEGKEAGQQLAFDDAEASGKKSVEAGGDSDMPPDDNEAIAVLAANFSSLGSCAKQEISRNGKFKGVTITFKWTPAGQASEVSTKEPELRNGPLAACIKQAMGGMKLPRFSGGPRAIEYPIRLK